MNDSEFTTPVSLASQIVIVTGGASGIGRATVLRLARAGAKVVISDINPQRIEQTAADAAAVCAEKEA